MNLISDQWIPTTTGHYSLSEILQQAAHCELQLEGMQFAGILRLLLAICYEGDETSAKLLKRKSVSQRTLDGLAQHHDMFELESGFLICNDLAGQSDSLNRLIPDLRRKSDNLAN